MPIGCGTIRLCRQEKKTEYNLPRLGRALLPSVYWSPFSYQLDVTNSDTQFDGVRVTEKGFRWERLLSIRKALVSSAKSQLQGGWWPEAPGAQPQAIT